MAGKLAHEIKQTKPFGSLAEEAILNIQRTSTLLERAAADTLKPFGLSETQYNVLRILRGAGAPGLACQEIGNRMISLEPDITRLLDRLESRGLIARSRSGEDRRVVVSRITAAGLKLLEPLDEVMRKLPKQILGHLGESRLRVLIDLLEQARHL